MADLAPPVTGRGAEVPGEIAAGGDCRLVDVGSTWIKGLAWQGGRFVNASHPRTPGAELEPQVKRVLEELGAAGDTRICSSANGGLRVGLLSLGKRVSGAAARRAIEPVGANIVYDLGWHEAASDQMPKVDVLVLAGGIDDHDSSRVLDGLRGLNLEPFGRDRLVYAGHKAGADLAVSRWPGTTVVANTLPSQMGAVAPLATHLRAAYIDDIESKADLVPLQPHSGVRIAPTPAVVSRAFARLQDRLVSPAMVIDVGGATTDVHFSVDLLDESAAPGRLDSYGDVGRHVYTGYGVSESRESCLNALTSSPAAIDLAAALDPDRHHEIYMRLLDGEASEDLLFHACVFMAIRGLAAEGDGAPEGSAPRLQLGRLATLGLTGGASQRLDAGDVRRVLSAAAGYRHPARVVVDTDYRWWGLGLLEPAHMTEELWGCLNV